jgi:formyl-CoA transferase/CoA:oxalate CoA-transferase
VEENPVAAGILTGVRVLDFTRDMTGPYATMVLGDYGADVIKVESAPKGDPLRSAGTDFIHGQSTMFLGWNRNKRSLCMDLRSPEAKSVIRRLVGNVDILIHNFRFGVPDQMGIGWEDARAINDRIIHIAVSSFGSKGPWRDRPGTDVLLQAMSGVMSVTGEHDGTPVLIGVPFASFVTAMVVVQAALLGLMGRGITGRGQHIEVPMLSVMISSLATRLGPYFLTGENPSAFGHQHSQLAPMQAFRTKDSFGFVSVLPDKWRAFCLVIGEDLLADDPRFANNEARMQHRDELATIIGTRMTRRTTAEWDRLFAEAGVAFGPVNRFSDVLESEQVRLNGMLTSVTHPTYGEVRQTAPMVSLSELAATIRRPPPLLGEHNSEILKEFGFTNTAIGSLFEAGVLYSPIEPVG